MTTDRKKLWIARVSCYNHDNQISGCSAVGSTRHLGHCCMMFERFFSNPGNPCYTMFSCPSYWIKVMKCLVFTTILTTMKWFFLFFLIYYFLISGCSSVDRTRGLGKRVRVSTYYCGKPRNPLQRNGFKKCFLKNRPKNTPFWPPIDLLVDIFFVNFFWYFCFFLL